MIRVDCSIIVACCSIRTLEDELSLVKSRSELVDNYERQIRRLKEDLAVFSTGRNYAPALPESVFCTDIQLKVSS
jgi:hypothetical protein